jgi:hypothetical protein
MVDARANTKGIKERLRDALSGGVTGLLDCEIPQSTKFRESEGITYLTLGNAKEVEPLKTSIERLAAVVRGAMGI